MIFPIGVSYFGEVPSCLVTIGRVYPRASTMHTVPMHGDLTKVVIEEVRDGSTIVQVPTSDINLAGEALGTRPTHLIKAISKK